MQPGRAAKLPGQPTTVYNLPPELAEHPQYEVLRELGQGGMGVVYLAKNKLMDRLEVLKVVNKSLLDHPGSVERFLREIRSAAKLNHANIVTAYSALQSGDLLAFAMEFVEGEDLAALVKARGPLPVANACHYVQQAALGLQHAFEKGMVHRDIKPHNLMLAREGKKHTVKVLDFGLAKATWEKDLDAELPGAGEIAGGRTTRLAELTGVGQMLGTPGYVAPEQTLDAARADVRADIYSLGCTLYYLVTGQPPYRGKNLTEILQAHQTTEARPLNLIRSDVPEELAAVVRKMMAKEPSQRYQTPAEVVQALSAAVKSSAKAGPMSLPQVPSSAAKGRTAEEQRLLRAETVLLPTGGTQATMMGVEAASADAGDAQAARTSRPDLARQDRGDHKRRAPGAAKKWLLGGGIGVGVLLLALLGLWLGTNGVSGRKTQRVANADTPPTENVPPKPETPKPETLKPETSKPETPKSESPKPPTPNPEPPKPPMPKPETPKPESPKPKVPEGILIVDANEASPDVYVDGEKQTITWKNDGKRAEIALKPGMRKVEVKKDGFTAWGEDVEIENGERRVLTARLIRSVAQYDLTGGYRFVHFGKDTTQVALHRGNFARVYDLWTGQAVTPPLKHEGGVYHAWFSPDGKRVVIVSYDKTARLWDAATGKEVTPPLKHEGLLYHVSFSPDGKCVVTASEDKTARLWDAATGKEVTPPLKHEGGVYHASFSPDGKRVVTASGDKTARLWDAATGKEVTPPLKHNFNVGRAAFSPDGKRVVTVCYDKIARLWDAATGKEVTPSLKHENYVDDASFSPDGKRVVTLSVDNTARLWDAATGEEVTPSLKHHYRVDHASFSPDGKHVVTVTTEGTARLWDAATGKELRRVTISLH